MDRWSIRIEVDYVWNDRDDERQMRMNYSLD